MRVLSLFDGMACGMLAMLEAGIDVERYVAFEIDKYAIQSATHNFPMIEERGDVFEADFTEFRGFDFLVGGSPCTYWSIAKKTGRETEASGMGWELFSQYVRALREAQPRWFVYENNKSMSNAIRESITQTFGFEPICINSALVSAQNRQRLYWVGRRNEDGTYSKVDVEQPEDRGILLKDVLDGAVAWQEKAFAYTTRCQAAIPSDTLKRHRHTMVAEPVRLPAYGQEDKARPLGANYPNNCGGFEHRMFSPNPNKQQVDMVAVPVRIPKYGAEGKSRPVSFSYAQQGPGQIAKNCFPENPNKQLYDYVAEPVCMRYERSEEAKAIRKQYEAGEVQHGFRELSELHPRPDGKTNTLSTVLKDNPICEPVCVAERGRWEDERWTQRFEAREDGKSNAHTQVQKDNAVCEPVNITADGKSQTIKAQYCKNSVANICCYTSTYGASGVAESVCCNGGGMGAKTGLYAIPVEPMIVKEATKQGYTKIRPGECVDMTQPNSKTRRGRNMADKSNCLMTSCQYYQYCGVLAYATPCEWDENGNVIKAISAADGKTYTVYEVKDGSITIKGKQYPIKLVDGYYIIRKLTVSECKRLQTVPEWYEFPVSDSQAFRQLGNGWTILIIAHLIKACLAPTQAKDATFCNKDGEYRWF